jgi:hypothetical protein
MIKTPQPHVLVLVNNNANEIALATSKYSEGKKGYPNAL